MAKIIVKNTSTKVAPVDTAGGLRVVDQGELAYSFYGDGHLFIGDTGTGYQVIGGEAFMNLLNQTGDKTAPLTAGTSVANKAAILGASKELDVLRVTSAPVEDDDVARKSDLDSIIPSQVSVNDKSGTVGPYGTYPLVFLDKAVGAGSGDCSLVSWNDYSADTEPHYNPNFKAIVATKFMGDGSGLTNVTASGVDENSVELGVDTTGSYIETITAIENSGIVVTDGGGETANATVNLKNYASLTDNQILKWDDTNGQLVNSLISESGTVVTIGGDLIVSGITTTVNSNEVNIGDSKLLLNSDYTGSTPSENAGFEVERGTQSNVQFIWDESEDQFSTDGQSLAASLFIGNVTGDVLIAGSAGDGLRILGGSPGPSIGTEGVGNGLKIYSATLEIDFDGNDLVNVGTITATEFVGTIDGGTWS